MKNLGTKMVVIVAVAAAFGCVEGEAQDPGFLVQRQAISSCGGFGEVTPPATDGDGDYCEAERLEWTYDAATETLQLTDARALLNCCGERSLTMTLVDGVNVITETDVPEGEGGRCDCMCVFDLRLTVGGLFGGILPVRVERLETDVASAPATIWEGEIDLGLAGGSVIMDPTDAGMWCRGGE